MIGTVFISAPDELYKTPTTRPQHGLMMRTLIYCLMSAVVGGIMVAAWNHHAENDKSGTPVVSPARVSTNRRPAPAPSRFGFVVDAGQSWQVRVARLRTELAGECGEADIRALYQMLASGCPKGEVPEHWYVIANDIMNHLLAHETDSNRFSTRMVGLLEDPRQPEVIRDYSVQCLASWLSPNSASNGASSLPSPTPEGATEVLRAMVASATSPELEQTSIPGTTLMMLVEIKRAGSVDCAKTVEMLKPWLQRALQDGSTLNHSARVSAVSAAGILMPEEFRPVIRRIAYSDKGASTLRLPAVAALGYAGEADDLPILECIAETSPELSYAAQEAAKVLAEGNGHP